MFASLKTKPLVVLALLLWAASFQPLKGQQITNLMTYPAGVTGNEPAYLIASTLFTSGGCILNNYTVTVDYLPFVPVVQVAATYCMGVLTVICERTDTIPLGILPAGPYNVQFTVSVGFFDGNSCPPPYIQGSTGNVSLIVNPVSPIYATVIDAQTSFNPFCSLLDTLLLSTDIMFTSGDCDLQNYTVTFPEPNAATITATYCVGDLTVICNQQNTFTIAPLNYTGGNYALTLVVKDCNTGNTLTTYNQVFSTEVEPCLGVQPPMLPASGISLVQNPVKQELRFDFNQLAHLLPDELRIFTPDGRLATYIGITATHDPVSFSMPAAGLYIYAVYSQGRVIDKGKALVLGE